MSGVAQAVGDDVVGGKIGRGQRRTVVLAGDVEVTLVDLENGRTGPARDRADLRGEFHPGHGQGR